MPLLSRKPKLTPEQRRERAQDSGARAALFREARVAVRAMQKPEPVRGLYVSVFLVLVGVYSYLSTDVETLTHTIKHKTVSYSASVQHPAAAVVLLVLALAAAGTIYWRRRLVTGVAFMLAAALGIGTPLPKSVGSYQWVVFLVPAAYVLWMLIFRMNKEQKDFIAKRRPGGARTASSPRARGAGGPTERPRRGKGKQEPVATMPSGRPMPAPSRRYTPPRPKAKAGDK